MGLPKGQTNNPNGRPKGAKNKVSLELQQTLANVLDDEAENLPELLKSLEPRYRVEAIVKLLPYVIPKNSKIEMDEESRRELWGAVHITPEEAKAYNKALEEEY